MEHFSAFLIVVLFFAASNFTVLVQSHCSHEPCSQPQKAAIFSEKALINPPDCLKNVSSYKQQERGVHLKSHNITPQKTVVYLNYLRGCFCVEDH